MKFCFVNVVIAVVFTSQFYTNINAQVEQDWADQLANRDSHFMYRTSIGLGLTGVKTSHRAMLMDENGFEYDLFSVLSRGAYQDIGLTKEQYNEVCEAYSNAMVAMKNHPQSSIVNDDQSGLEAIFSETRERIRNQFSDQQLLKLEQLKHQQGANELGLAKYFSSSQFVDNDGISESDQQKLQEFEERINEARTSQWKKLMQEGNRTFLKQLPDEQRKLLEEIAGIGFENSFVDSFMFVDFKHFKTYKSKSKVSSALALKRKSARKKHIIKDLTRLGTVNSVCRGNIADILSLSDEESRALHSKGREIFTSLTKQAADLDTHSFEIELAKLPPGLNKTLHQSMGAFCDLNERSRIARQ